MDAATYSSGWAYYENDFIMGSPQFDFGVVQCFDPYPFTRYREQHIQFEKIAAKYKPDILVVEMGFGSTQHTDGTRYRTPVTDRSLNVTMMLAAVRGAIASAFDCPVIEISNTEWKSGLGIHDAEMLDREEVKRVVYNIVCQKMELILPFTMKGKKATYDVSDAGGLLIDFLENKRWDE